MRSLISSFMCVLLIGLLLRVALRNTAVAGTADEIRVFGDAMAASCRQPNHHRTTTANGRG